MAVDRDIDIQEPCPNCAKPRAEWSEGSGEGYATEDGLVYCSESCALRALAAQVR
jgi:hypothetical protein